MSFEKATLLEKPGIEDVTLSEYIPPEHMDALAKYVQLKVSRPSVATLVIDTIALTTLSFMNLSFISSNMFTGFWHMLDPWNLGFSLWGIIPPLCGYMVIPCICCMPVVWNWLQVEDNRHILRMITVLLYATMTQVNPFYRTMTIMIGTGLGLIQFFTCLTMMEILSIGNSMFLMVTLRWALSSLNAVDLQVNWVPAWAIYTVGFLSVAWLCVAPVHAPTCDIKKQRPDVPFYHTITAAWVVGKIIILHTWLFTTDVVIVRWAKMEPYPAGICIIFALLVGSMAQYAWYVIDHSYRTPFSFGISASALFGSILIALNVPHSIEGDEVWRGDGTMLLTGGFFLGLALPTLTTISLTSLKLGLASVHSAVRFLCVLMSGAMMMLGYILLLVWFIGRMVAEQPLMEYMHGNVCVLLLFLVLPVIVIIPSQNWYVLHYHPDSGFAEHKTSQTKYTKAISIVWGLILLIVFIPGFRMRSWYHASRGSIDTPTTFTVMTWNIQEGYEAYVSVDGQATVGMSNLERQSEVINHYRPHVVGLQESDAAQPLTSNRDLPGFLGERGGYYVEYGAPGFIGTPGVALLGALPLKNNKVFMMPRKTAPLRRMLVSADFPYYDPITLKRQDIHVFNTHMEWFDAEARVAQLAFIKEKVAETTGPAVLMGDFNMNMSMLAPIWNPDQQPVMIPVNMTNKPADTPNLDFFTEIVGDPPGQGIKLTLDHIFYRDLCLVGFKVAQVYGVSDHLPVIATFTTHDLTTGEPCITGPINWDLISNPPKVDRIHRFL